MTANYAGDCWAITCRASYGSGNDLMYVLGDDLGSTSAIVDASGSVQAQQYDHPYGANRGGAQSDLTDQRNRRLRPPHRQHHESGLAGTEGLHYYNARWWALAGGQCLSESAEPIRHDPALAPSQADTIVPEPGNPQALNRFTYVYNNPVRYTHPSGQYHTDIAGSQGFREEYQDPYGLANPQTVHFWYYVRYAYEAGYTWAQAGNIFHELKDSDSGSWEDYWLGNEGANLGVGLRDYGRYGMRPSDIEGWPRERIFTTTQ